MVHQVVVEHLEVLVHQEVLEQEEHLVLQVRVEHLVLVLVEHLAHLDKMDIQDVHLMIFIILEVHYTHLILMYQHH